MTEHDIAVTAIILSFGSALLNLVLIPVAKAAAKGEVKELISDHNKEPDAHPNLAHAAKLESTLNLMREDSTKIRESIANLRVDLALSRDRDDK